MDVAKWDNVERDLYNFNICKKWKSCVSETRIDVATFSIARARSLSAEYHKGSKMTYLSVARDFCDRFHVLTIIKQSFSMTSSCEYGLDAFA